MRCLRSEDSSAKGVISQPEETRLRSEIIVLISGTYHSSFFDKIPT